MLLLYLYISHNFIFAVDFQCHLIIVCALICMMNLHYETVYTHEMSLSGWPNRVLWSLKFVFGLDSTELFYISEIIS